MSAIGKGSVLAAGRTASMTGFRDRRVPVRSVPCPTCEVAVGEDCVSANGKKASHPSRRRMALRVEVTSWDSADIRFARTLATSERRGIRVRNKLSQSGLATLVGATPGDINRWERGVVPSKGEQAAAYGAWLREHRDVVA